MGLTTYPKIKKISPQLLVADIERSIEFYTTLLGFVLDFRYEDFYAGVTKNGCSIHLKTGNPSIDERQNKRNNEHLDIIFSVENIEHVYEQFTTKSIDIIQSLRTMPYGKEFYIADPDGYIIAFSDEA